MKFNKLLTIILVSVLTSITTNNFMLNKIYYRDDLKNIMLDKYRIIQNKVIDVFMDTIPEIILKLAKKGEVELSVSKNEHKKIFKEEIVDKLNIVAPGWNYTVSNRSKYIIKNKLGLMFPDSQIVLNDTHFYINWDWDETF